MIKKIYLSLIAIASILIFSYLFFGIVGVKTILGIFLIFSLPFYLILDKFDIDIDEKLFFSFFIGIGILPVIVFYFNRVIPSLRIALIVVVILLYASGFLIKIVRKKYEKKL